MDALPLDVQLKIAAMVADHDPNEPWRDAGTIVRAAAACMATSKSMWPIGLAAFKSLIQSRDLPDMSTSLPSTDSKVIELRQALRSRNLKISGTKAELWQRLREAYIPLCPVPPGARDALKKEIAPAVAYTLGRDCSAKDAPQMSLQLFGSVAGWRNAQMTNARAARVRQVEVDGIMASIPNASVLARDAMREYVMYGLIDIQPVIDREKVRAAERRARHLRRAELVALLNERGCSLRYDSRLCDQYIEDGKGDARRIADTMVEMKFFFMRTRYFELYGRIKHRIIAEERDYYDDGWVPVNPDAVSAKAKAVALREWIKERGAEEALADPALPHTLKGIVEGFVDGGMVDAIDSRLFTL